MFRRSAVAPGRLAALERIEALTRERFGLSAAAMVLVNELPGTLPGYPPLETRVQFWTADGVRYRYRVFKPAGEVGPGDIPVAWLLPSLVDDDDAGCC